VNAQSLVTAHLPLAKKVAAAMARRMPLPREDIESAAMLGLVQAARAYDATRGSFEGFATVRIRGAIQDEARAVDPLGREHRKAVKAGRPGAHAPVHVDIHDVATQVSGEVGSTVAEWTSAQHLREMLRHLPKRLQVVVRRSFLDEATLSEIGDELGVTESRACQLLTEAKERLRVRLQPYEREVDEDHVRLWRRRGCRRQERCVRGHELTGYNVIVSRRTEPRKTKAPYTSTIRTCRRCKVERTRLWRWSCGTRPFASFHQGRQKLAKLGDAQVQEVLAALAAGQRVAAIARQYGVSPLVIRLVRDGRTYRDVPRPAGFRAVRLPSGKLRPGQAQAIANRLAAGERACALALEYEISEASVSDIRHGRCHRRVTRGPGCLGDARRRRSKQAKLSDREVESARAALRSGTASVAEVARRLGVAWNTIGALRDGRTYRHVADQ
jgi:RNA polymerase sigma factor (sigma-70 family)